MYQSFDESRGTPTHLASYIDLYAVFDFDHLEFYHRLTKTVLFFFTMSMNFLWNQYMVSHWTGRLIDSDFNFIDFDKTGVFGFQEVPLIFDAPRPLTPDIKSVGEGARCLLGAKTLPDNYINFVEDPSSKGTIIVAFGHFLKWESAPEYIIETFWETFASLTDYRIIWQYNGPKYKKNLQ